jgi:hypothetical protein
LAGSAIACLLVLGPWLARNVLACGNPLFPFATDIFGHAHWTAEQAANWTHGHRSDVSVSDSLVALWNQFFRFGIGSQPESHAPGEPWKPQWLILPWLAMIGLLFTATIPRFRRWSAYLSIVMLAQILFWVLFTHLQSRFLLPMAVPLSAATSMGLGSLLEFVSAGPWRRVSMAVLAIGLFAWCSAPAAILRNEAGGAPAAAIGAADHFAGNDLKNPRETDIAGSLFPSAYINLQPATNPRSKVLLIGEAAPLYFEPGRISYCTVWDRGPLSELMRDYPDDPAAWADGLLKEGFSQLLINPGMLDRWQRSGWADPHLTAKRVLNFAESFGRLQQRFPRGELLFDIVGSQTPTERIPSDEADQSPLPLVSFGS